MVSEITGKVTCLLAAEGTGIPKCHGPQAYLLNMLGGMTRKMPFNQTMKKATALVSLLYKKSLQFFFLLLGGGSLCNVQPAENVSGVGSSAGTGRARDICVL